MGPLPAALGKFLLSASLVSGLPVGDIENTTEQTTCTYDDPSKTVTVTAPDLGQPAFVILTAEAGVITFQELDFRTFEFGPKAPCGAATTTNTDLIRGTGGGVTGLLLFADQTFGPFAPGFTSEATGTSEIEFEFQSIGGLLFVGEATPAIVRLGTLGANINGDDDVDVTFTGSPTAFGFFGGPGADDIQSTGGYATGDVATMDFGAGGGEGSDVLVAGNGLAFLDGGGGNDTLIGGPADDSLRGGSGNDRLSAGPGNDDLDGGSGNDILRGGPGRDDLNGARGRDKCVGGPGKDTVEKCE